MSDVHPDNYLWNVIVDLNDDVDPCADEEGTIARALTAAGLIPDTDWADDLVVRATGDLAQEIEYTIDQGDDWSTAVVIDGRTIDIIIPVEIR